MAWFYASKEVVCATAASVRVILSAKVVWVATNNANVAESVQTASIIARKSLKICCDGGPDVLSPSYVVGAGGTGGAGMSAM